MMDGDGAKGKVLKQLLELFSLSTPPPRGQFQGKEIDEECEKTLLMS